MLDECLETLKERLASIFQSLSRVLEKEKRIRALKELVDFQSLSRVLVEDDGCLVHVDKFSFQSLSRVLVEYRDVGDMLWRPSLFQSLSRVLV